MVTVYYIDPLADTVRGSPGYTVYLEMIDEDWAPIGVVRECAYDLRSKNLSPCGSVHLEEHGQVVLVISVMQSTFKWTVVVDSNKVATVVATFVPDETTAVLFDPPLRAGERTAIRRDERLLCLCKSEGNFSTRPEAVRFIKTEGFKFAA